MRLTQRRRAAIEKLIDFANTPVGDFPYGMTPELREVRDAAFLIEYLINRERDDRWQLVDLGKTIMCDCGEKDCFKAMEILPNQLVLYTDVTDLTEPFIVFDLHERYAIFKRTR